MSKCLIIISYLNKNNAKFPSLFYVYTKKLVTPKLNYILYVNEYNDKDVYVYVNDDVSYNARHTFIFNYVFNDDEDDYDDVCVYVTYNAPYMLITTKMQMKMYFWKCILI